MTNVKSPRVDRPLPYAIKLRDGQVIATLNDAVDLLMNLPESLRTGVWIKATSEVATAQYSVDSNAIPAATDQLEHALAVWDLSEKNDGDERRRPLHIVK